jgi:hypothetical protein
MRRFIGLAALATTPLAAFAAAAKPACPFDAALVEGGRVYYMDGARAVALADTALIEGQQRKPINLYYVVKAAPGERSGALVVKSARLGVPLKDDDPRFDRVALQRLEASRKCDPNKPPFVGSVSTRAYSEYHDYGQDNGDYLGADEGGATARQQLQKFHTSYERIDGICRATDAKTRSDESYEARSNRSQFSFDIDVVDNGFQGAVYHIAAQKLTALWSVFVPSAYADPQNKLRERRVEIKHYRTEGGVACVAFTIGVRGPAQVLRVNDLEGRGVNSDARAEYRLGPMIGASP